MTQTASFAITGSDDTPPATGVTIIGTAGNDVISPTQTVAGQPFATAYADTIFGNAGKDSIDGGAGDDRMVGGAGDDTYFVRSAGDVVEELAGGGYDIVWAYGDHTLAANVEALLLASSNALNGTGNAGNNNLTGNWRDNVLTGLAGNDNLFGGTGRDTAVYTGLFADYTIDRQASTVSSVLEGRDKLNSIEVLQFADGSYDWASGFFLEA